MPKDVEPKSEVAPYEEPEPSPDDVDAFHAAIAGDPVATEPEDEAEEPSADEEEAEDAEEEETDEAEAEEEKPKRRRRSARSRIAELVAERNAERQRRAELERRLAALEARFQEQQKKTAQPGDELEELPSEIDGVKLPAFEDFYNDDGEFDEKAYQQAFAKYQAKLAKFMARREAEAIIEQRRRQEAVQTFQAEEAAYAEENPDYIEAAKVVRQALMPDGQTPTNMAFVEAMVESGFGVETVHVLGQMPDLLNEVLSMRDANAIVETMEQVFRELAGEEDEGEEPEERKAPKVTKRTVKAVEVSSAPEMPPVDLAGGESGTLPDVTSMSIDEYINAAGTDTKPKIVPRT